MARVAVIGWTAMSKHSTARRMAILCTGALLLPACTDASDKSPAPRLNVLLVTLDTTRADRLSCYDPSRETTPHIDALAAEGVRFAEAISTAGITPMSHSSILTGLNNYRHGMRVFHSESVSHRLKDSVETLPELLRDRGWRTGAFVSSYPVSGIYGLDQGFDTFDLGIDVDALDLTGQQKHATNFYDGEKSNTQRRGDFTVSKALEWLDTNGRADPWCMWVHMFDVHDYSLVPPAEFASRYGIEYPDDVTSQDVEWRERMYDPELAFMDVQVERLLEWVRASGQWEDTLIVITADHGQGLIDGGERHGWVKHRLIYDWSIHVPLVVRIPGERTGLVVEPLVRTIDILPTVLEALDLPSPDLEGRSLLGLVRGEPDEPRVAYADALNLEDEHAPRKWRDEYIDNLFCVREQRWKLIWHQTKEEFTELFDLDADPLELHNVAAEHPEQVARLRAFLDERRAAETEPPDTSHAGADAEALKNLGYLDDDGGDDGAPPSKN